MLHFTTVPTIIVAVELPEKQGLKPYEETIPHRKRDCCSGTSRKTRIETCSVDTGSNPVLSCSGTSRKTRIETLVFMLY